MKKEISVQILGKTYPFESELDPLYVNALAKYVEDKMRQISANTVNQTTLTIAVLAALDIADELFSLRTEHQNLTSVVNKKTDELISLIDNTLKADF